MVGTSWSAQCNFERSFNPIVSADSAIGSDVSSPIAPSTDNFRVYPNNAPLIGKTYIITYQLKTLTGTLVASVPITIEIKLKKCLESEMVLPSLAS